MRLTADLINGSLSYQNPLQERELDLRGHKIPNIENLGVAKDQESIDFTDNDITILGNFPLSPRLKTLLCARNRITSIQGSLSQNAPNLETLVLTQNNIVELADLDPLQSFHNLTHLVLVENPVTSKEHYRYWVLWRCAHVRFLDFKKVKTAEREKANEMFGSVEQPSDLAVSIIAASSKKMPGYAVAPVNGGVKRAKIQLTEKEKKKLQELVQNSKSLAEVERLQKALDEGRIPPGLLAADDTADGT